MAAARKPEGEVDPLQDDTYEEMQPTAMTGPQPRGAEESELPSSTAVSVPPAPRIPTAMQPPLQEPEAPTAAPSATASRGERLPDIHTLFSIPEWITLHPMLPPYLAEAIGTFFFVLTIALVEINNPVLSGKRDTNISPLPIGFALMTVVLALGPVSGGHFNPAITTAVMLFTRKDFMKYLSYIVVQCGAAVGAGIVSMLIQGSQAIIVPDVNNDAEYIRKGFFAELVYTFALATVVLNLHHSKQEASVYYAFSIAMVMTAGIASVGGVSGGAFNPAVALGLQLSVCLVGRCVPLMHFWLYWLAPSVGAALAALIFSGLHKPEPSRDEPSPPKFPVA